MFRPLRDHILVKPFPRKDSEILAIVTTRRMNRGQVMATGPGRPVNRDRESAFIPMAIKPGDIVSYGETPMIFQEYEEDGEKYLILQEADIAFVEDQLNQ